MVHAILADGVHFVGVNVVHGGYLFYDGMKRPPLEWIYANTPFSEKGDDFAVEQLWYRCDCDADDDASDYEGGNDVNDEDNESESETIDEPAPKRPKMQEPNPKPLLRHMKDAKAARTPTPKPKAKRKKRPMGISIATVARTGPVPECKYCLGKIQRAHWHTVRRAKTAGDNWDHTHHYHFACFKHLSLDERDQLLEIMRASEYILDTYANQLATAMEEVRGQNDD